MNILAALMTRLMPQGVGGTTGGEAAPMIGAGDFAALFGQAGAVQAVPATGAPGQPIPAAIASDIAALLGSAQADTGGTSETGTEGETALPGIGLSDRDTSTDIPADIAAIVAGAFVVPATVATPLSVSARSSDTASASLKTATATATALPLPLPTAAPAMDAAAPVSSETTAQPLSAFTPSTGAAAPLPLPTTNDAAAPASQGSVAISAQATPQPALQPAQQPAAVPPVAATTSEAPVVAQLAVTAVQPQLQPSAAPRKPVIAPAAATPVVGSTDAVGSTEADKVSVALKVPSLPEATSLLSLLTPRNAARAAVMPTPATTLATRETPADATTAPTPATFDPATAPIAVAAAPIAPPPLRLVDPAQPAADVSAQLGQSVIDLSSGGQWIDGLAREIASMASGDGRGSFRLSPDHLGPMRVDLLPVENGVSIHLSVEVEEAASILARESTHLKTEAQAAGIRVADVAVERVRVVHEPARTDSGAQTGSQSQGQSQHQTSSWTQASTGQGGSSTGQGNQSPARKASSDGAVLNHAETRDLGADDAESGIRRARYA